MDFGLVSIITPTWNCARFIGETIQSVLAQTYQNWEMIIVDDCSTDDTYDVVKSYIDKDNRIQYRCNEKNSGAAITRNNALKTARGKWIAFLDSDDLWKPEKLEKQLTFMHNHSLCFSYTNYVEIDENSKELGVKVTGPQKINYRAKYCYLLNEPLALYRKRVGSISRHGYLSLIIWHYRLFKEAEHKPMITSIFWTAVNLCAGMLKKILFVSQYNPLSK